MSANTENSKSDSPSEGKLTDYNTELSAILSSFPKDPLGVFDIGKDGVLRSLTADREVLHAVGLPNHLIKTLLDRGPFNQDCEDKFRGVDGTAVPKEQWFHPDKELLPPPMTSEEKAKALEQIERYEALVKEGKAKERTEGGKAECRVPVSNYDLSPKPGN